MNRSPWNLERTYDEWILSRESAEDVSEIESRAVPWIFPDTLQMITFFALLFIFSIRIIDPTMAINTPP